MFITDAGGSTTVQPDSTDANAGMPSELVLKKVSYTDTNGNAQTIYVQQTTDGNITHKKLHLHLSTAFLALGIVSFGLGIFLALKKIKK